MTLGLAVAISKDFANEVISTGTLDYLAMATYPSRGRRGNLIMNMQYLHSGLTNIIEKMNILFRQICTA